MFAWCQRQWRSALQQKWFTIQDSAMIVRRWNVSKFDLKWFWNQMLVGIGIVVVIVVVVVVVVVVVDVIGLNPATQ